MLSNFSLCMHFEKYEHNSIIFSTSLESKPFSSFSKAKSGTSFKASDSSGLDCYSFFSPSLLILRMIFCEKREKHPDMVAVGSAFSKVFVAASSKSIKTLSGAISGGAATKYPGNVYLFSVLFGYIPNTQAGAIPGP